MGVATVGVGRYWTVWPSMENIATVFGQVRSARWVCGQSSPYFVTRLTSMDFFLGTSAANYILRHETVV